MWSGGVACCACRKLERASSCQIAENAIKNRLGEIRSVQYLSPRLHRFVVKVSADA